MAAKRNPSRAHWPTGLYVVRGDYFCYRSPISSRMMALGKVPEADAVEYANWANQHATEADLADKIGRIKAPHAQVDRRGLLEASHIAAKAMVFDRIIGVYFLLKGEQIVYVGRSTNIMNRLARHNLDATKAFNRVFIVECPLAALDQTERMYIDKFKPIYNSACPPVDPKSPLWSESINDLLEAAIHRPKCL